MGRQLQRTTARLRDAKGLADLAVLLAAPGRDVHVLTLAGATELRAARRPAPVLDYDARRAYHRWLRGLASAIDDATDRGDALTRERLESDRDTLLDELRRATGLGGRARSLGADAGERARKAVPARLRDAVRRVAASNADLGCTSGTPS